MMIKDEEISLFNQEISKLLDHKQDIKNELDKTKVARAIISSGNYLCTISIMEIPKGNKEIRLFEELDKMAGVINK